LPGHAIESRIWVDADACPVVIKQILFRAAERKKIEVVLVANQFIRIPPSPFIRFIKVAAGFDVADHTIVNEVRGGDLVITSDIPLAAAVIEKRALALSPRGEPFTPENIRERLDIRDFMETLRSSGIVTGGPAAMKPSDHQAFANQLDRFLAQL